MNVFKFILLLFICYAPISVILRNKANMIVNNKNELWTIKNNQKMMSILKYKSKLVYWLMQLEIVIFVTFIMCIIKIFI